MKSAYRQAKARLKRLRKIQKARERRGPKPDLEFYGAGQPNLYKDFKSRMDRDP